MKNEQRIERKPKRPQKIIEQKIYVYDEVRDDDVFQTRQRDPGTSPNLLEGRARPGSPSSRRECPRRAGRERTSGYRPRFTAPKDENRRRVKSGGREERVTGTLRAGRRRRFDGIRRRHIPSSSVTGKRPAQPIAPLPTPFNLDLTIPKDPSSLSPHPEDQVVREGVESDRHHGHER